MRAAAARPRGDRGSAVVEMVALLPLYVAFIVAVVFVGKLNNSSANIEAAARSAARTLSLDRDPLSGEALAEARELASTMADEGQPFCTTMTFTRQPERDDPADPQRLTAVTVEISCVVDMPEATFIKLPGTRTLRATATESIDRYREGT